MKKLSLLFVVLLLVVFSAGFGQKTWTGTTSTAWNVSTNWSPVGVPISSDNVTIPSAPVNQPVLSGTTGTCNNLTINSGASLSISATSLNNATLTVSGTATLNGSLSISGALTKYGKLVAVNINWSSTASFSGYLNGLFDISGNWEFGSGTSVTMGLCPVHLTGSTNSNIISKSSSSSFGSLIIDKNSGYYAYISTTSTTSLKLTGSLTINTGNKIYGQASITTIILGNINNLGNFHFNAGTVSMEKTSGTQSIQVNTGDYFNSLQINGGSTVTVNNNVYIHDDMIIQSGTFDPQNYTVYVTGDWVNTAGPDSFTEGTGKVVFYLLVTYNGPTAMDNYCNYSENFYILEMHNQGGYLIINSSSAIVTCNQYEYTYGGIKVQEGTFTAYDLADAGLYGYYGVEDGGTINLTNTGSYVDLAGNLNISGGNFNVYGGLDDSYWPNGGNATLTLSGGTLNFADNGINIILHATYNFVENITGGTIRTTGDFLNSRNDFTPAGGTIEMYGTTDALLGCGTGVMRNFTINKGTSNTVTLSEYISFGGILTIEEGTLKGINKTVICADDLNINNGGTLWLEEASALVVMGGKEINVINGGTLKLLGYSGHEPLVSQIPSTGFHEFYVSGTLSARYATFEYNYGINLYDISQIDPANPLDNCTFQNVADRCLYINNSQTVTIRNANFPTAPTFENVKKVNNSGRITFKDATGAYAGATYENDPYNRIDWVASQPGLWTGLVSSDWFNTGNWDDLTVPTSATNVTIPTGAPNMPVLTSGSPVCNHLTVTGTLTIRAVTMQVNGSLAVNGTLAMNNASGILNVMGNVSWNSLSVASISAAATINVYGNWTFNVGSNAQLGNGTVYFKGSTGKTITSLSANCSFWNLTTNKTGLAVTEFSNSSTQPLTINGGFTVLVNSKFISSSSQNINVKGNLTSGGIMQCNLGRINLNGTSHVITPNTNDYLYHLDLNHSGTVTIGNTFTNVLNLKGGLLIFSGVLDAGGNTIKIGNDFFCPAGPTGFSAGTSRVVFNGSGTQNIFHDETFNTLEIYKPSGELLINGRTVTCSSFDWTSGLLWVTNGGTFTALDLEDDGIYCPMLVQVGSTINLHQDDFHHIDLGTDLSLSDGGVINVYGGNGWSQWPYGANASITMDDGTLDFKDQGINVSSLSPQSLTLNITGGTIRTPKGFFCNRPDFNPAGGELEMYGSDDANLEMYAGSLHQLYINKGSALAPLSGIVTLISDITINGILWAGPGTFRATGKTITSNSAISVENGGTFWLENGSILKLAENKLLNVQQGGLLKVTGTATTKPLITRNGTTGNYLVQVDGTISARNAIFEYTKGILIYAPGSVDPSNPFDSCTFRNGIDQFLKFENSQSLIIRGASFPTATATYNVWKSYNAGRITFKDATGAFSGPAYELDPYDRIDWAVTQPGLWTGLVSTDWHTAGNWDDLKVPTTATDVTIPETAPNMPVVGTATAYCNKLYLDGTLTIQNKTLEVAGNANISGLLAMNSYLGKLEVQGDINWKPGSTASITANAYIIVYGNWIFNAGSNAVLTNGSVSFAGTSSAHIYCMSSASTFGDVYISKTGGASVEFDVMSEEPLRTKGFFVEMNSAFNSSCQQPIIVTANFYSFSHTHLTNGAVILDGADHLIIPHPDAYFHDIVFDQSGTVTINQTNTDVMRVMNGLTINSGVFSPGNSIIEVGGDWKNNAGTAAFNEGTSRVRFNSTNYGQACTTEDFNILEVDIADGHFYSLIYSDITCQVYDWTDGGLHIDGTGSSFYAADLADNGIYGDNIIRRTVELHQDASQSVDVIGNITINSPAGELIVYGGNDQSKWGYGGNASLTMTSGIMDFVNQSVQFIDTPPYSFTSTISGGKIRSSGGVMVQSPGFSPTGGEVEIYGNSDGMLVASDGGSFYNLTVNKASTTPTVTLFNTLINNDFQVSKGYCYIAFGNVMECRGDIDVNNGGWFSVHGSTLKLGNLSTLYVHSGGQLTAQGWTGGGEGIFTSNYPSAYYSVIIESGAWLLMNDAIVENVGGNGFYMAPGSIGLGSNLFHNCIFRNGQPGANALLTIDNSQDITIDGAEFTSTPWGSQYNVRKTSNTGTLTFTNYTGNFAGETYENDPDNRIHWINEPSMILTPLFLQGLYDGNQMMRQAYDDMGPHWPAGVADHITVELHDAGNYLNILYSYPDVELSTSGWASVPISSVSNDDYYITIRHRNSIETTSALPVTFNGSTFSYSFGSPSQVYGDNLLNWNGTGTYVIWGADINQDGIVDGSDMNAADNASTAITFGYVPEDVNGDGLVDGGDINMVDNNITAIVMAYLP